MKYLLICLGVLMLIGCSDENTNHTRNDGQYSRMNDPKIQGSILIAHLKKGKIRTIKLKDGSNGRIANIAGEKDVKEFLSLFQEINLEKISDQQIKGYPYSAEIGEDFITFYREMIHLNDDYYKTDKEIPLNKIQNYFK